MSVRVVAVHTGPAGQPPRRAWVRCDLPAGFPGGAGEDPQAALSALVGGLAWGGKAVLLLVSSRPWPPLTGRDGHAELILRQLAETVPGLPATTQPEAWPGAAPLLLAWGCAGPAGEGAQLPADPAAADPAAADQAAAGDVASAGHALARLLAAGDIPAAARRRPPGHSGNALTAAALWAGLTVDPRELCQDVVVIACSPREA